MKKILQNSAIWLVATFIAGAAQTGAAQWSGSNPVYPTNINAKVGIGLNNPATQLHLKSTTVNPFRLESSADFNYMSYFTASGYKGYSGLTNFANDMEFGTSNNNPNGKVHLSIRFFPKLTVDTSGNVGIGTVTPATKLHVKGSGYAISVFRLESDNTAARMELHTSAGNKGYVGVSDNDFEIGTNGGSAGKTHLVTNAARRLTVDKDGKVGIGTTGPATPFHVKSASGNPFRLESTASTNWMSFYISNIEKGYAGIKSSSGDMYFGGSSQNTNGGIQLLTKGSSRLTISSNGNVGIGTTTPAARLHVKSSDDNSVRMETAGTKNWISFYTSGGYYKGYAGVFSGSNDMDFGTGAGNTTGNVHLVTGTALGVTPRLTVFANGNVGIGTASDAYKLSVNGTIRATEVRVETGWADYVFDKNFRLRPLAEVEAFIQEHKHLPDVTSAADIQKDGLQVAKQMTEMMQKVEELTLYVIQLNKENAALRTRIEVLEGQRQ